ncbi:MAG TPA: M1 family aminopeptidase, partial [Methyloversatilis sp.]
MTRMPFWLALQALVLLPAHAAPRYDLAVKLDPAAGRLAARARITLPAGEPMALRLDARHRIETMTLDGRPLRARTGDGFRRIDLAPAARARRLDVRWTIRAAAPDAQASHRDTLTRAAPQIGQDGSFLPAGGAWYPLPFDAAGPLLHRYRLEVELPAAQRALAPGDLISETLRDGRRQVRFDMRNDSEGADLMAGPWLEARRTVRARDGRMLTLVTLFHPAIAELSAGYLDAAASHLAQLEGVVGDYPYSRFTIASSPTPTGFGMAGLTYLGIDVLRLPFIRNTSLPHEILHNWWGNGVHPAPGSGNWSEGLTTFMADYAQREAQGEDAARTMRLDWLRGLSALSPQDQGRLADFTARTHDASQVVGYHKAAMVFLMLRDTIGQPAFDDALHRFWRTYRHRRAGWSELRVAFEQASGRDLSRFFAQWVDGSGLVRPRVAAAEIGRDGLVLTLEQPAPAYMLDLPLTLKTDAAIRTERVHVDGLHTRITLPAGSGCTELALDPDFRLARQLAAGEAPPILREATLDADIGLTVLAGGDAKLEAGARTLAGEWLDHPPGEVGADEPPSRGARMVIGSTAGIDRW